MVAGFMVIPIFLAIAFIKEYPSDLGQEPDGGPATETAADSKIQVSTRSNTDHLRTTHEWTPSQAYRTTAFWIIVILSCISQYAWFFFTSQWLPIMRSFYFPPTLAAFTVSTFTIASLPARVVAGFLIDKIKPKFIFMIGFFCTALAYIIALMIRADTIALAFVASVFAALGFGLCYIGFTTTTAQYYGVKAYSKLNGNVLMIESIVSCLAPMITGLLFASFGNYSISFILIIILGVIGFFLSLFLNIPKPPKSLPDSMLRT
jgi:MFS family permease